MSAGVNAERFEREIQLAARLQHPHILPPLTNGASPELQPALREVRERLGRLTQEPGT
jgi:hypothetical protein